MKICKLTESTITPSKTFALDAGLDIYLPNDISIKPHTTEVVGLKIKVEIPEGFAGMLVPRSSIAAKGISVATSVIDTDYSGEIHAIITNTTNNEITLEHDSRVCSLILISILNSRVDIVDDIQSLYRGKNKLGSSGK